MQRSKINAKGQRAVSIHPTVNVAKTEYTNAKKTHHCNNSSTPINQFNNVQQSATNAGVVNVVVWVVAVQVQCSAGGVRSSGNNQRSTTTPFVTAMYAVTTRRQLATRTKSTVFKNL